MDQGESKLRECLATSPFEWTIRHFPDRIQVKMYKGDLAVSAMISDVLIWESAKLPYLFPQIKQELHYALTH